MGIDRGVHCMNKVVVLLSGGLDSTVALANAVDKGHEVVAVSFDYGQSHVKELEAAKRIADHYKVPHQIIDIRGILAGASALTGALEIPDTHATDIDATYVPGRNLVMVSIGAAVAEAVGAGAVVIGANADDNAGYKDCRPAFIDALDNAVRNGTLNGVCVWAPFICMTKKDIVDLSRSIGAPIGWSWSCYRGGETSCMNCGACESREDAFK